jgi:phosphoribosyl-ATP pyrophosphohydrolase
MSQAAFTRARPRPDDRSSRPHQVAAREIGANLALAPEGARPPERQDPLPAASAGAATSAELERLYRSLGEATETVNPRSFRLLQSGNRRIAQKLIGEAGEVAIEAVRHRTKSTVRESADLLYHLVALWHRAGVKPGDVWLEMRSRAERFGLAEKLPKPHDD